MTNNSFNQTFIRCSAHTVCGIKPANLFTISEIDFFEKSFWYWKRVLKRQGILVTAFKTSSGKVMIFVYNFLWIRKLLEDSFIQAYLKGKGYFCVENITKTIQELIIRLQFNESFPHEVGVFLGYPIEDVISFEEKQGHLCKYCGYWKSYCNPEEAKKCCEKYKHCSQMCKKWFEEGYSIPQIIKKYKEMVRVAA